MVKNTGRRLLTVAADAEPIEVRSRSVCSNVSLSRKGILEDFTGSQQHELWRRAENTGTKELIQAGSLESFLLDSEEESPLVAPDNFGASQQDAMARSVFVG